MSDVSLVRSSGTPNFAIKTVFILVLVTCDDADQYFRVSHSVLFSVINLWATVLSILSYYRYFKLLVVGTTEYEDVCKFLTYIFIS